MYSSEESLPRRRRTPSFSSSLLDAIYRSIDESKSDHNHNHNHHHQKIRSQTKKSSSSSSMCERDFEFRYSSNNNNNLRRAMMIESWIEKQQSSASSSSESTIWSSSESAEPNPKPTKPRASEPPAKPSSGFSRTKLRALKLYGELKKVRQPISPGGRIASFLTSIFGSGGSGAAGAVKKAKMCYVGADDDVAAAPSSSAKSCLIQEAKGGEKIIRSVRFYPVSVVLGEDSKPCGQRRVRDRDRCDPCLMPLSSSSVRRSFEKKSGVIRRFCDDHHHDEDDDEEEDDDLSYSSSDLFEIDHHRVVGVGRYREELPVYETTSLKTNQAIANGLVF